MFVIFCEFRPVVLFRWVLCAAVAFSLAGGCSSQHYKADADKEVYKIIDGKWQNDFGQRANYTVSDVSPSPNDVQIEKAVPPSGVITLAQAVAIATAHNRDYQTRKEQLYLTALDLTLERYRFARQWFGTIDAGYARGDRRFGDSEDERVNYDADVGFKQLLADGAQISTSIAIDWARFLTGDPSTSLGSVLSASITQPLLRGASRKIVREKLTQAERDVLYQIRIFNRYRKTFVVSIVTDYYRILQQKNIVTNAENNYKRRVELKKRSQMEADTGVRPRFEVDQAEQEVHKAKDRFVSEQQRYKQRLDEFKIRLSLPTDANVELDYNELKSLEKIGISQPDYTLNTATETALLQRLDLANSAERIVDATRKAMVAADSLGAELNLIGSAGVGSTGKTDYSRLQFHKGTYSLGLEVDLPLDRKTERNAYRESLIALEQRQRQYDEDRDEVKLDVRQAYRQLAEEAESYRIQKSSLELAQRRVDSMPLLLETGRARTRDLLESQDALLEAQNSVTAALVNHTIAKLSLFRDIGVLQVRPDGMWVQ